MTVEPDAAQVKAAGGVVWRTGPDGEARFALVHRPRYDDWSLPKGKLDRGESWEDAAVREVEEEIGLRCALGDELAPIGYVDHKGRAKAVRYWLMETAQEPDFVANDEVDELRWMRGEKALGKLSYHRDRGVLEEAIRALAVRV
jgi:8-oxo-dGTP diphosphatase